MDAGFTESGLTQPRIVSAMSVFWNLEYILERGHKPIGDINIIPIQWIMSSGSTTALLKTIIKCLTDSMLLLGFIVDEVLGYLFTGVQLCCARIDPEEFPTYPHTS